MNTLTGEVLTLPKMSGSVSSPKSLSGNVGAKTINIGGKGDDGATFIPSVSADGVISWTNNQNLPNPEPVNIKGTKGDKGDKGDRGLQGVQGIQGERGEQGLKGDKGDRGEQGIQGVQGAKGETGAQGQKGADGTPATHRWSGTTLYITSASGTSSANLKGDKGDKGDPGADGKDGADGFSPVVVVEDIDGGHRVTITDKDGDKTFDVMDGEDGQGGNGGPAIIDVIELPTENIDEDSFYRLLTGTFVYNQYTHNGFTCYCVNGLPETGEPATNADMSTVIAYYNTQDSELYGYLDAMLSQFFGIPIGWYPASMLFQAAGLAYSGVITDILDDPMDSTFRVLLEYVLYSYKDGKWTPHKTIGWAGDGAGAEVFNHPRNVALGECSHAEGYCTHAEGNSSHTEGRFSHTDGIDSHAEGYFTHAEGSSSHAEGYCTHAEGSSSHAEGEFSHAEGNCTHAEGYCTHAVGRLQHVQGKYNAIDPQYNPDTPNFRAKYAHIVGNGTDDDHRSNAHTLDWNGLGWFAGGLKVGGTGQDDENSVAVLTTADMPDIIAQVIAALPIYNGEVETV